MKRYVTGTLAAAIWLSVVGCGDDGGTDADAGDAPTARASSILSDGLWRRSVTESEAQAAGIGPTELADLLGEDGQAVFELEIDGDRWKQYQVEDDGSRVLGDLGTWSLDDDGNWVTISDSPGCRGCAGVVKLSGTTDRMTTQVQGEVTDPLVRLVSDGTWERQS